MVVRVDQTGVVTVVGGVDDRLEWGVEEVGHRVESLLSQRFQEGEVLVSDQDVSGVPFLPDQLFGVLEVDVLVAVDVYICRTGESVGERKKVEQIVREICDTVVLDGDVEDVVTGIGRGVVDVVSRAHAAVLA